MSIFDKQFLQAVGISMVEIASSLSTSPAEISSCINSEDMYFNPSRFQQLFEFWHERSPELENRMRVLANSVWREMLSLENVTWYSAQLTFHDGGSIILGSFEAVSPKHAQDKVIQLLISKGVDLSNITQEVSTYGRLTLKNGIEVHIAPMLFLEDRISLAAELGK